MEIVSDSPLVSCCGGKTIGDSKVDEYCVIWRHIASLRALAVSNLGATERHSNISRARSERKLNEKNTSPSARPPSLRSPVGLRNSSVIGSGRA